MSSLQSTALKHWARIIKQWPVDKVRPESVAFQKLMQQRIDRSTNPAAVSAPASSTSASTSKKTGVTVEPRAWNEAKEMREANVLYNLLDDRYAKQMPMPQALRHPASNPSHYDDLVREMEEAPSRSWFSNVMNRVRGSLRLS